MYNESIFSKICGQDLVDCKILIRLRQKPRLDVEINENGAFFQGVCIAHVKLAKEDTSHDRKLQPTA